jgi:hypothetical protein
MHAGNFFCFCLCSISLVSVMGTQFAATSKMSFNNKDFSGLLDYLMHSNFWV